jgi:pyrimidine operon attenuation protein/uracil phosphoribosyltransferase
MSLPDPEALVLAMADAMRATVARDAAVVGIFTGGAWVAERLHRALALPTPLGLLAVTLHRDDFGRIGLHRESRRSQIPFPVDGREVILVDDVLHTGRTIRAALNELFDFGRPRAVRLAILADRGGRQLPMCPDYLGAGPGRRRRGAGPLQRERPASRHAKAHEARLQVDRAGGSHLLTTEAAGGGDPPHPIRRPVRLRGEREVKKAPLLRGKSIFNIFFETPRAREPPSRSGGASADVINLNVGVSDIQGRDAARHRLQPAGDGRGHVRRATESGAVSSRAT